MISILKELLDDFFSLSHTLPFPFEFGCARTWPSALQKRKPKKVYFREFPGFRELISKSSALTTKQTIPLNCLMNVTTLLLE